jgi:uncharacterized protein
MSNRPAVDRLIEDLLAGDPLAAVPPMPDGLDLDEVGTHGRTPLMVVAAEGLLATAEVLVRAGASARTVGQYQMTALHEAAANGHVQMVEFLLSHRAELDAKTVQGVTPLMCAAAWGYTTVVGLLLARGANSKLTDQAGSTAADIAREKNEDAAAELIEALGRSQ